MAVTVKVGNRGALGINLADQNTIKGDPGFSPTVEIEQIQGGHRVIITDLEGEHAFDVIDYVVGRAISRVVINEDYTMTIWFTDGTVYNSISLRGPQGDTGPAGADGHDGQDGEDGYSPSVTITPITGGNTVKITDKDHPTGQSFNVMDGATGATGPAGPGVASGGAKGKFLVKKSATNYDTEWGDPALSFTVTLSSASWVGNAQTVSNANFVANGYAYIVSPASASFTAYGEAQIYADNVTTDGQMTFHCDSEPSADLTVNVVRVVSA